MDMKYYSLYKDLPEQSGIYFLYNKKTASYYIGSAIRKKGIRDRVANIVDRLIHHRQIGPKLQKAWDEDDSCWISGVCELTEDRSREHHFIKLYNSIALGYNERAGARFDKDEIVDILSDIKSDLEDDNKTAALDKINRILNNL